MVQGYGESGFNILPLLSSRERQQHLRECRYLSQNRILSNAITAKERSTLKYSQTLPFIRTSPRIEWVRFVKHILYMPY